MPKSDMICNNKDELRNWVGSDKYDAERILFPVRVMIVFRGFHNQYEIFEEL